MRRRLSARVPAWLPLLLLLPWLTVPFAPAAALCAETPAFDLAGPKVDVHVMRAGVTLPIAEVPNLLAGDRLWIHPDLPESQSAHYILIVCFLRGVTNPPPPEWFKRVETWNRQVREEGVFVVVPAEAEQALIFLAPETGGDFSTLRAAVRGRPGAFVRASQDLQQASWDRLRLDAYLAQVHADALAEAQDPILGPNILKERTEMAARSLGIRVDQQCFDKPTEQQAPCLVQHTDGMVMDDSNAQSAVGQMAGGAAGDMMNQLSYSALAGAGEFSPYVGAIIDLAKVLSTFHTAHYQYIPALALPQREQKDTLNLRLNVPPSFRDPKSVIVVALPPIGPSHPPQLAVASAAATASPSAGQHAEPNQNSAAGIVPAAQTAYCATKPGLTLGAGGAPLVFGTAMAYDLVLHLETKAAAAPAASHPDPAHPELLPTDPQLAAGAGLGSQGNSQGVSSGIDIPLIPEPSQGGFVLSKPAPALPESDLVGELRGKWGFDTFSGPKFHLREPHPGEWVVPAADRNALITGRDDSLRLQGESTLCVQTIQATLPDSGNRTAKPVDLAWKSPKPEQIDLSVPLKDSAPGTVTIAIHQYGLVQPDLLSLKAYAEAAALDHLSLSAGDRRAVLKGRRLDEVEAADLDGIAFTPSGLNRVQDFDELEMSTTGVTQTLRPGKYSARVTLRDGRELHVPAVVDPARPQIELLSKGIQHEQSGSQAAQPPLRLGSPDDLPLERRLVFFLRSTVPAVFPRTEKVEIAAADGPESPAGSQAGGMATTLSFADGSLILEDARTAVAVMDPLARFGPSAFGPIRMRAVSAEGVAGDWVPLGTLVRLPEFPDTNALRCPRNPAKPCQLSGSSLFLMTAVSASPDMANATDVPGEFAGTTIAVPNVRGAGSSNYATLYLRLRDDPNTVQALSLPVTGPASAAMTAAEAEPGSGQPSGVNPGPAAAAAPAATGKPASANPAGAGPDPGPPPAVKSGQPQAPATDPKP